MSRKFFLYLIRPNPATPSGYTFIALVYAHVLEQAVESSGN